jgi:hypothetical protein
MKRTHEPAKIQGRTIKAADFRVWCAGCSIRIAPHEDQISLDGQIYHPRCYSKDFGPTPDPSGRKT